MNSEQTANILAFYSYYHPEENLDRIALDFKVPAGIIVNGLYYGVNNGLFKATKDGPQYKDITVTTPPSVDDDFGKDMARIKDNILEIVTNLNSDKEDITDDNIFIWLGVPLIMSKTALKLLVKEGKLATYKLVDEKDKKSKYDFYTLTKNKTKKYGKAQFKKDRRKDESIPSRKQ